MNTSSPNTDMPPPPSPPPPPPGQSYRTYQDPVVQPRQLWRSRENRRFAGVCGGLAEYFGVDPILIRLGMVALFISGIGFLLYPLAWLMIPKRPRHQPYAHDHFARPIRNRTPGDRNLAATLAVLAAVGIMLTSFGAVNWLPLGVLLIGGGVWLLSQDPTGQAQAAPAPEPVTATPTPAAPEPKANKKPEDMTDDELLAAADWSTDDVFEEPMPPSAPPAPIPVRRRRSRAWIALPVLLIAGLLAIPAVAVGLHWGDGVGDRQIIVTDLAELESEYRLGAGELLLDLSGLDMQGESRRVEVFIGAGEITVIAPTDAGGTASLAAVVGEVAFDQPGFETTHSEGVNAELGPLQLTGDNGELNLSLHARAGVIEVVQGR